MTIDRTYPFFTVRWLAGLAVPTFGVNISNAVHPMRNLMRIIELYQIRMNKMLN